MAILPNQGRVTIAESISARPVHVAWGLGDGAWTTPPPENINAAALINEVGRREATELAYVIPDVDGDVIVPSGRYTKVAYATRSMYVRAQFEFADAPSSEIREAAVFIGTVVDVGLPPGQEYFPPADVTDPGRLLSISNLAPIFRSPAIRESIEVVVNF